MTPKNEATPRPWRVRVSEDNPMRSGDILDANGFVVGGGGSSLDPPRVRVERAREIVSAVNALDALRELTQAASRALNYIRECGREDDGEQLTDLARSVALPLERVLSKIHGGSR